MNRREPRPALRRSEDGSVHPAAPRVEPEKHLHPVPHAPAAATRRAITTAPTLTATTSAATYSGKPAKLSVEIPKDLRKQARMAAEHSGRSLDTVVAEALARYLTEDD